MSYALLFIQGDNLAELWVNFLLLETAEDGSDTSAPPAGSPRGSDAKSAVTQNKVAPPSNIAHQHPLPQPKPPVSLPFPPKNPYEST
jgi:hypothetical protein